MSKTYEEGRIDGLKRAIDLIHKNYISDTDIDSVDPSDDVVWNLVSVIKDEVNNVVIDNIQN